MYLKAIEISNFKSFKGEVTIPLDRGFTAITGPNGSGKSNCGDAIQFVLGPRSNKTIRAQNSKDLIFNGGKNSKPARSCEVTLIFANPVLSSKRRRLPIDSDEVRMTRKIRLTKSNNVVTNYLLDGEESSQKSFHRILGAANARPDGYNIVLQGDVTSLAKMTSKERRKVLDSVAGVTSYDEEIRKADKQKENVEDLKKWWARLADPIAEKMGITSDEFIEMMYKKTVTGDWTEFGDDAVKLKWADHVVSRIHETALLKNPDAKIVAPTTTRSAAIENGLTPAIDDNGNHYMILPRRNPKDLYLMHNPDGFYRFK